MRQGVKFLVSEGTQLQARQSTVNGQWKAVVQARVAHYKTLHAVDNPRAVVNLYLECFHLSSGVDGRAFAKVCILV
jgi:hypothetical protein